MASRRRHRVQLVRARPLSPTVRSLVFQLTEPDPTFTWVPGQYLDLFVPSASGLVMRRSYSVASAPGVEGPGAFEIAVTRVVDGPTSEALHALPIGAYAEAEGPFGNFRFHGVPDEAHVFIAAGTGLAPLRAMLQAELPRRGGEGQPPLVLLFGCRDEEHVLWRDELQGWANTYPAFRFNVTLSRPPASWTGWTGYVQRHAASLVTGYRPAQAYVCGLTDMVEEVVRILWEDVGLDRRVIHYETYD